MATDIITTLHPDTDPDVNLYPNILKENIPNNSVDSSKLDEGINSLLNSINELRPSGVDTSTNILAFTEDKGIYIGSDTGYWYYWNGTQYVAGGVYQTAVNYDRLQANIEDICPISVDPWERDKYITPRGTIVNDSGRDISNYVICYPGSTVRYVAETDHYNIAGISFWDKNKQYLSCISNNGPSGVEQTAVVPRGAKYLRLCNNRGKISTNSCYVKQEKSIVDFYQLYTQSFAYVLPTEGSDITGDGSMEHPYKTLGKAISSKAKDIFLYAGYVYNESIIVDEEREELNIHCIIPNYSTDMKMRKAIITSATELNFSIGSSGLMECSYSTENTSMMYKCFVSQTEDIEDTSSPRSSGYKCNLWYIDEITNDVKLTPVLSYALCLATPNSWYYDGNKIYANTSESTLTLNDGDNETCISIKNIKNVNISGVKVLHSNGSKNAMEFVRCYTVLVENCECGYCALTNGFYGSKSNIKFINCKSYRNRNDGFNFDDYGSTEFINCEGIYNYDDGISHHGGCVGYINGGEYAYNGKGGIAPVYLSEISIDGAYSHNNTYGLLASGSGSERIFNSVFINNGLDLRIDGMTVTIYNTKYSSYTFDEASTVTVIE